MRSTVTHRGRQAVKTRYPIIAALLFVLLPRVAAQDVTRVDFRLDADLARFHGGDSLTYVEVYYGVSEAALTYRRDSTGLRGGIDMEIVVSRGGEEVYSRRWSIPRVLSDSGDAATARNILSLETLGLTEGVYTVELH
ncbi:MAG TPA: hypothetical protein VLA34_14070, partial [Candidatus Krumholzibacterium sp.]|nr:hypothetical protein [Candidatus Krumholzibacterium sp.]